MIRNRQSKSAGLLPLRLLLPLLLLPPLLLLLLLCPVATGADRPRVLRAGDAGAAGEQVAALIGAFGPWDTAIEALAAAGPSPQMAAAAGGVRAVAEAMQDRHPKAEILLDPAELRGFDYHSGLSFVLYAKGIRGELGRGGLYPACSSPAAGFTLYMDTILRALPAPVRPEKVRVAADADAGEVARRRAAGEVIVADLD